MTTVPRLPAPPNVQGIPEELQGYLRDLVFTLQQFMYNVERDYQPLNAPVVLVPSTVSGLNGYQTQSGTYIYKPALTQNSAARLAFCSNASGGAVPVYSTGTQWLRVTDGSVVT
tara:strand:- start:986 stop:1327 length:342 start_codon:yes stop_codon:yes gene_type:complete